MRVRVGTSGYAYREWKPGFYPQDLPAGEMLRFYAERLPTVEINNTFYRMPSKKMLQGWSAEVPGEFCFALKASRRITHFKRLKDVGTELDFLFSNLLVLGERLGPVLFQLPPGFAKDLSRLRDFLAQLPPGRSHALEFRDPSWFDGEVYAVLRDNQVALCVTEDEDGETPLVPTARFGYVRLRRDYSRDELQTWAKRLRTEPWEEAFVYFKHETAAPNVALEFGTLLGA